MHSESVILTLAAIFALSITFVAGCDIGQRNLVTNIDTYGCEKVIAKYHGTGK